MASMNVSVPDAMRDWVQGRIESGEYTSASDYVRDLIRRDQDAHALQAKVADIRRTIEEGRAIARNGPVDEVFSRIEAQLRGMAS